jgi:hypothetical protein
VTNVKKQRRPRSPPRLSTVKALAADQLWSLLTDEQRQRTLVTLSGIVLRQIDVPRDDLEVRDELS